MVHNKFYRKCKSGNFEKTVLDLADDMAASAASLNQQSYKQLLDSREELKKFLHEFVETHEET